MSLSEKDVHERQNAISDAMYDCGCVAPPRTNHLIDHFVPVLEKSGWVIVRDPDSLDDNDESREVCDVPR